MPETTEEVRPGTSTKVVYRSRAARSRQPGSVWCGVITRLRRCRRGVRRHRRGALSVLVQRERDVDDLSAGRERADEGCLTVKNVHPVEALLSTGGQRGEPAVGAVGGLVVDVEPGPGPCVHSQVSGGGEGAGVGRGLEGDAVVDRVDVEQGGGGGRVDVVVGVGGSGDAERGRGRCGRVGEGAVDGGGAWCGRVVDVVAQVLAGVADDAQAVGGGVEVDAEVLTRQCDGELGDLDCLRVAVDGVDAALVADAVELAVLDPEVDTDQLPVPLRPDTLPNDQLSPGLVTWKPTRRWSEVSPTLMRLGDAARPRGPNGVGSVSADASAGAARDSAMAPAAAAGRRRVRTVALRTVVGPPFGTGRVHPLFRCPLRSGLGPWGNTPRMDHKDAPSCGRSGVSPVATDLSGRPPTLPRPAAESSRSPPCASTSLGDAGSAPQPPRGHRSRGGYAGSATLFRLHPGPRILCSGPCTVQVLPVHDRGARFPPALLRRFPVGVRVLAAPAIPPQT